MTTLNRSPSLRSLRLARPLGGRVGRGLMSAMGLLALIVVTGACATDEESSPGEGSVSVAETTTTGAGSSTAPSPSSEPATTADATTTSEGTTTAPTGATTLPGEPFDGFARAGDRMLVVGVAHDDALNARSGPGTNHPVVAELAPTAEGIVATGRARLLSTTIWYEIDLGSTTGWVNSSFVAFAGSVDDITSQVVSAAGARPSAATMVELGVQVAELRSSDDVDSRIVLTVAPTVGDLAEVTYDVIGLADDAVYGARLHIFARPDDSGGRFTLVSVERRDLCGRGVSASGLCV